jgi:quinohemoprotein ethanol dehydrogenase
MPRRVLTFALDAHAELPPAPPPFKSAAPEDPSYRADRELENEGVVAYHMACAACHGGLAVSAGTAPDLRVSPVPLQRAAFDAVVRQGQLVSQGMPQFADLPVEQVESIRQYIRSRGQAIGKPDATPQSPASQQIAVPR